LPFPIGGAFVIGDQNAAIGGSVTFWSAQWARSNDLSGGPAPSSFKGFEDGNIAPKCGGVWTAAPGESSHAPDEVPPVMAVVVAGTVRQSGSTISGDIRRIVLVQTASGYDSNPGHRGSAQVIAVVCG
jgi:hypothetical protein